MAISLRHKLHKWFQIKVLGMYVCL